MERKKVVAMEQKILHLSDKNVQISQRLSGCGEDVAEPESYLQAVGTAVERG